MVKVILQITARTILLLSLLATEDGFGPSLSLSESDVLPLHYSAFYKRKKPFPTFDQIGKGSSKIYFLLQSLFRIVNPFRQETIIALFMAVKGHESCPHC